MDYFIFYFSINKTRIVLFSIKIGIYIQHFFVKHTPLKNITTLLFCLFILDQCGAQDLSNILLSNFNAKGKVVELSLIDAYEGNQFTIATYNKKTKAISSEAYFARAGKHCYEMRHLEGWNGQVDFLATDIPKTALIAVTLVEPNIIQTFDLSLTKESLTPSTINFCRPTLFFSYPTNYFLLGLATFIFLLAYFIKNKKLSIALFVSCFSVFILMDARSMIAHFRVFKAAKKHAPLSVPAVALPEQFVNIVKPIIGNGDWTIEGKLEDELHELFIKYRLANTHFVKRAQPGTFIITIADNSSTDKNVLARVKSPFYKDLLLMQKISNK